VAYCYRPSSVVSRSVCRSVIVLSPAKTAEPIEMPFGSKTRVDPKNHALDGVHIPHGNRQFLQGKGRTIVKYRDTLRSSVHKWLNRSRCSLGCGLGWAQGIVLDGGPEVLRNVAMATNFGMQFAITGFV